MATEWQISRHGDRCAACGHNFDENQPFRAYLYESRDPVGLLRRDFCMDCTAAADESLIGFWKTRRATAARKSGMPFDRDAILAFFTRLDADSPERAQFRFVLALLLWRKKVLRFDATEDTVDGEVWRFVLPRDGTIHAVRKPDLDDAEIDRLSAQLERLLGSGEGLSDDAAGQRQPATPAALPDVAAESSVTAAQPEVAPEPSNV